MEGRGPVGELLETTSGDGGRFEIVGLASGPHAIWAASDDFGISHRVTVDIGEADPLEVTLVVSKLGRWKGRVLAADGKPVSSARLELEAVGAAAHWASTRSDASGSFEVGLPHEVDRLLVRVSAPSHVL